MNSSADANGYTCRGCGIRIGNKSAYSKCPSCGIKYD